MFRLAILALVFAPGPLAAQTTGKITGVVTDSITHQPIPKVHVSCVSGAQTGVLNSGQFVGALTGVDGSYTLEDVPAGKIRMTVNLDGYKFIIDGPDRPNANSGFPLAVGETATRNFEMHPLGRIYGKLVDRDTGKTISGHTVSAERREYQAGQTYFMGRTGEQKDGEFNIQNLEPGDYWIRIDPADQGKFVFPADASPKPAPQKSYGNTWYPDVPRIEMAATIHIGEGESRRVDISLTSRETHSLTGTIKAEREFESKPVALALQSSAMPALLQGPVARLPVPGSFRIDNLAPGAYHLLLTGGTVPDNVRTFADYLDAEGFSRNQSSTLAAGDADFEIVDRDIDDFRVALAPYAGVSGEVRMLEKDAKLPDKLVVSMFPATEGPVFVAVAGVTSGRFRQPALRPGEYWPQLTHLPDGYAVAQVLFEGASPRNSTVILIAQDTPITFVITSRPGAVTGVVRGEDQSPVRGATVILLPDPLPDKPSRETIQAKVSGDEGAFLF